MLKEVVPLTFVPHIFVQVKFGACHITGLWIAKTSKFLSTWKQPSIHLCFIIFILIMQRTVLADHKIELDRMF